MLAPVNYCFCINNSVCLFVFLQAVKCCSAPLKSTHRHEATAGRPSGAPQCQWEHWADTGNNKHSLPPGGLLWTHMEAEEDHRGKLTVQTDSDTHSVYFIWCSHCLQNNNNMKLTYCRQVSSVVASSFLTSASRKLWGNSMKNTDQHT